MSRPFIRVRLTEDEARNLLELLDSVQRTDELAPADAIADYDRITDRIRRARIQFRKHGPRSRFGGVA